MGFTSCITCGKKNHPKDVDAGHFISRGHASVLFNENNVFAQCKFCNAPGLGGDDAKRVFRESVVERVGEEQVQEVEKLAQIPTKIKDLEYLAQIQYYEEEVEKLLLDKGIEKWWK